VIFVISGVVWKSELTRFRGGKKEISNQPILGRAVAVEGGLIVLMSIWSICSPCGVENMRLEIDLGELQCGS
jgi:hypothetical protein